jgi:hypothetical protein
MARAAKEAEGRKDALAHLRWRRFTLQGKLKARRHESPEDWLKRLRREREVIWWALTKDASDEELLRAGSWLLQRVTEPDIVILTDKGLLPTRRFEADLARLQRIIVRSNVRLLPLPPKPEHWTQPTIYRSGLKVNFLPHHNKAHQVSIIKSFKSRRFQNQHRAAANRLGDVPLRIDHWTLDLVDRYAVAVKDYKDEHRRLAYGQEIDRTVAEASRLLRRGAFCNTRITLISVAASIAIRTSIMRAETASGRYIVLTLPPCLVRTASAGSWSMPPIVSVWISSRMRNVSLGRNQTIARSTAL